MALGVTTTMKPASSAVYVALLASSLYANKYVLSVLGFQYPMVFQGWQTLVGFVVFKAMAWLGFSTGGVTAMDKAGLISLFPNFVLFVVFIISGSKAVSSYPVIAFVCAVNVLPALTYLIDSYASVGGLGGGGSGGGGSGGGSGIKNAGGNTVLQKMAALVALPSAAAVIWATTFYDPSSSDESTSAGAAGAQQQHEMSNERQLTAAGSAPGGGGPGLIFDDVFWLAVHVGCGMALSFHSRIVDQRFSFSERLFYSYVFALVVLAPASLYLEEAFEALNFQHRRQFNFLLGSVFSAGVGVALSLCQSRLKEDPMFGRLHHTALALAALLSAAFFTTSLPWWGWLAAVVNLAAVVLVPSHIRPDEKIQTSLSSTSTTTTSGGGNLNNRRTGGVRIKINGSDQEDQVSLLEPDEADLEVGRINEAAAAVAVAKKTTTVAS